MEGSVPENTAIWQAARSLVSNLFIVPAYGRGGGVGRGLGAGVALGVGVAVGVSVAVAVAVAVGDGVGVPAANGSLSVKTSACWVLLMATRPSSHPVRWLVAIAIW